MSHRVLVSTLLALAVPAQAAPQTVSVLVLGPAEGGRALVERVLRVAEVALKELSSLRCASAVAPKRACAQASQCLSELAALSGSDEVLILDLAAKPSTLTVEGYWVDRGERRVIRRQLSGARIDDPDGALRSFVETLLPPYARRGFGGVTLSAEAGATVKVDGRKMGVAPLHEPLALASGRHTVDVLMPAGTAVLYRQVIEEGARAAMRAGAGQSGALGTGRGEVLLWTSYGVFGAGALAVAGALIAGAFSRRELAGTEPCIGVDRSCLTQTEVDERLRRSGAYARNANVLLGAGAVLGGAGASLFAFDLLGQRTDR